MLQLVVMGALEVVDTSVPVCKGANLEPWRVFRIIAAPRISVANRTKGTNWKYGWLLAIAWQMHGCKLAIHSCYAAPPADSCTSPVVVPAALALASHDVLVFYR